MITKEQRNKLLKEIEEASWIDGEDHAIYIGDVEFILDANTEKKCAIHPPVYIKDWEQGHKICEICKEKWLPAPKHLR